MLDQLSPGEDLSQNLYRFQALPCGCVPTEWDGQRCQEYHALKAERDDVRGIYGEGSVEHHRLIVRIAAHLSREGI